MQKTKKYPFLNGHLSNFIEFSVLLIWIFILNLHDICYCSLIFCNIYPDVYCMAVTIYAFFRSVFSLHYSLAWDNFIPKMEYKLILIEISVLII